MPVLALPADAAALFAHGSSEESEKYLTFFRNFMEVETPVDNYTAITMTRAQAFTQQFYEEGPRVCGFDKSGAESAHRKLTEKTWIMFIDWSYFRLMIRPQYRRCVGEDDERMVPLIIDVQPYVFFLNTEDELSEYTLETVCLLLW